MNVQPIRLDIHRVAIPMRRFEHAAAARNVAENVVVRMEFSDGSAGWGETLPRDYVTGETIETVLSDLPEAIWPAVAGRDLGPNGEMPPFAAAGEGRCRNAALCAVESACAWRSPNLPGRARIDARVSGVLGSADPARTAKHLRLMRWFGLRDFKLKLGFDEDTDAENLRIVGGKLAGRIARGRGSLRVDVNGGWDTATAPERIDALKPHGVCVVEQPVTGSAGELVELAQRCELPLMADESLLTLDDARTLAAAGDRVWWNIRISKNGGPLQALRLAQLAAERNIPFTVGCMVGETSILSALQRIVLQQAPRPRFVEGNYGRLLLSDDLTSRSLRFGYNGRLRAITDLAAVAPQAGKLARYGDLVDSLIS
jgi:L-Ala-D/L-Glu epimerase